VITRLEIALSVQCWRRSDSKHRRLAIEFNPAEPSGAYFVTMTGQVLLTRCGKNFTPVQLLRSGPNSTDVRPRFNKF
jgi:hypothetical protein